MKTVPVLPSINIKQSIMFYETVLGFTGINAGDHAVLKKDDTELHLTECHDKSVCEGSSCYIKVTDVFCLYSRLASQGIIYPANKLLDLPGGKKGFTLKDNSGVLLHFVQEKF